MSFVSDVFFVSRKQTCVCSHCVATLPAARSLRRGRLGPMISDMKRGTLRESLGRNIIWINDWIGLREILQETIDFPIKYVAFL